MVQVLTDSMSKLNDILWGPIPALSNVPVLGWLSPLAILLVGTGLWFTFSLGFIQIRGFKKGWNSVFGGMLKKSEKAGAHGMSSFQALATAIAAQVGTGNIVGASTAIAAGGPGAIFWMWIAAFFGMATIFVEATLAQKYKKVGDDGQVTGGPVYYITAAFKGSFGKVLAAIFAILIILSLGFLGCAVQSNGIATAWNTVANSNGNMQTVNILGANVPIIQPIVGIILALVAFLIFAGGISSIASFTEKVVPAMACIFILGSLFVIITHISWIPEIFGKIFTGAFTPKAVFGGAIGVMIKDAVSKGVARGLFSNEAGMGSTPHAHAVAKVAHPTHQGYVAMIGVFIDTFIILNLTAFIVIGSGKYDMTKNFKDAAAAKKQEIVTAMQEKFGIADAANKSAWELKKAVDDQIDAIKAIKDKKELTDAQIAIQVNVAKDYIDNQIVEIQKDKKLAANEISEKVKKLQDDINGQITAITSKQALTKEQIETQVKALEKWSAYKFLADEDGEVNMTGAALAQAGFRQGLGTIGNIFIAFCLTFFAFSTVIGWYFFGEANFKYLFGSKAIKIYAIIVCVCVFLGTLAKVSWIWNLQDNLNGMMVIPNLIGILALTKVAKTLMKEDDVHEMLHK